MTVKITKGYYKQNVYINGRIENLYSKIPVKNGVYQLVKNSCFVSKSDTMLVFVSYNTIIGEANLITKEAHLTSKFYSNTTVQHRAKLTRWLNNNGFNVKRDFD